MTGLKIGLIVIACVGLILTITGVGWGIKWYTADIRGAIEQREDTIANADFRIYSYNHFFDLCVAIQEIEAQYDAQSELLNGTERQGRVVAVLKARVEQLKRQYNVDSAKEETVALFKSNNLPFYITVTNHSYGDRTGCTYND